MTTPTPEERLAALGLTLPSVPTLMAGTMPYRLAGNLLFLSGQGPKLADEGSKVGRLRQGRSWSRARLRSGAAHRAAIARGRQSRGRRAFARRGGGQASRHGQRRAGFRRPSQGHQRLLRPHGRGARRGGRPCAPSRLVHGFAAEPHHGRDRGYSADQSLRSGEAPFDIGPD